MNNKLVIIGAGGHSKVCAEIAELSGYNDIIYLDDSDSAPSFVKGKISTLPNYIKDYDVFVAIGNNENRKHVSQIAENLGANFATLIHPDSIVSKKTVINSGTVVMAGAVINVDAYIGKGSIINTCASVDHDCSIGSYTHISVGARLAGTVIVDEDTFVGAGATILNNLTVCKSCLIGAGAVLTKNAIIPGVYIGVPARLVQ